MPRPYDLDLWPFDLESGVRVTWATSVPILVFLGLSILDLGPMYATNVRRRQTSDSIIAFNTPAYGRGNNNEYEILISTLTSAYAE